MGQRRYKAFVSYSHADKAVANWLHHALETYRLPDALAGEEGKRPLHPIFKDREELPAADSLGEAVDAALAQSDALIVLCSPSAAASPWVNGEIDHFKRIHGEGRVLAVAVEGDPPETFPPALRVRYADGEPTDEAAEPIAADIRPEGDGRKLAKLKLVAGLTGVDLDALVQRDAARKQKRTAIVAGLSALGMVATSSLAAYAIDQRDEARIQRAEADGLIEYMLTDLRKQLEPVGRLEVLDGVGRRAMDYYARQKLADLSARELGRRVRATQLVAEVQNLRGNNAEALPAFREAARTTAELLARDPDDPERLFNHGQSLFWVGYIAWQRGQMDDARRAMEGYADISRRLAAKDRSNLDWQMEEAYSQSNLGTMEFEEGRYREAIDYFERNVAGTDAVSKKEGRPVAREIEIAEGLSWKSSALERLGLFDEAAASRQRELDLYDQLEKRDPGNSDIARGKLFAQAVLGRLLIRSARRDKGKRMIDEAIATAELQIAADPDDTLPRELIRGAIRDRAMIAWATGDEGEAARYFARAQALNDDLRRRDPENVEWNVNDVAELDIYRALTVQAEAPPAEHRALAARILGEIDFADPDNDWLQVAARFIEAGARARMGDRKGAREAYRAAANAKNAVADKVDVRATALRAEAAARAGDAAAAQNFRARLEELGADPLIDDRLVGGRGA